MYPRTSAGILFTRTFRVLTNRYGIGIQRTEEIPISMTFESVYDIDTVLTRELLEKYDINLVVATIEDLAYTLSKRKDPPHGVHTLDLAPKSLELIKEIPISKLLFYKGELYERILQFLNKNIPVKDKKMQTFLYHLLFYFEMRLRVLYVCIMDGDPKLIDETREYQEKLACRFEYGNNKTFMVVYFNRQLEERKTENEKLTAVNRLLDFTGTLLSEAQTNSRILGYVERWKGVKKEATA